MARKIIWSPHAVKSLQEICIYIERDSPRHASLFAQRVIETIEKLSTAPEFGRIVPEYNNPLLREKILGNVLPIS